MIVKKLLVDSLEDALDRIAKDYGPGAKILETREIAVHSSEAFSPEKQIEVIFGVAEKDLEEFKKSVVVEVKAAQRQQPLTELLDLCDELIEYFDRKEAETLRFREEVKSQERAPKIEQRISAPTRIEKKSAGWIRELVEKGMPGEMMRELESRFSREVSELPLSELRKDQKLWRQMIRTLMAYLPTSGPLTVFPEELSFAALVGPRGAGKTTALFNLAYDFIHHQGLRVAILTHGRKTEADRIREEALSQAHQIPLIHVEDLEELPRTVRNAQQYHLILVDSMEGDAWNKQEVEQLHRGLDRLQVILTLSLQNDARELSRQVEEFKSFRPKRVLFTHIDQTSKLGEIAEVCYNSSLPICYLASSAKIDGGVEVADAERLAEEILQV